MRSQTVECPGKLNLGLYLTGKRADGYHLLETVFYPAPISDTLTLIELPAGQFTRITVGGLDIPGVPSENLCIHAWQAMREAFGDIKVPPVQILLHKRIPTGAGLGGGSSDAAGVLRVLAGWLGLPATDTRIQNLAVQLGADVPYFLYGGAMLATGIGELLSPIELNLSGYRIALVTPGIQSDTVAAYKALRPDDFLPRPGLSERLKLPVTTWRGMLHNGFERAVFGRFPELATQKRLLYDEGAVYASLSGSGSALFGIFPA